VVWPAARHPQGAALSAPGDVAAPAEPVFRREGDAFVPTAHSRGPWDPDSQHGGAPAALLAEAVRAPGMHVARLTYDFVGPVPVGRTLRIETRVIRPGGRLQLVEADLLGEDEAPVVRLRAMRLRRSEISGLPIGADAEAVPGGAGPETAERSDFPLEPPDAEGFHRTAMEIRFAAGTSYGRGPGVTWFRFARPLVGRDDPSPLALAVAAADFGNGISRVLDFDRHLFVNTDLTIHLRREPVGEWVMLDSRTRVEPTGVGLAASTLYDQTGAIGLSAQSLYVAER
jgi:acyl-Coa thioesterase superfamily protein/acyl-CoA thioesterase superfamily protein